MNLISAELHLGNFYQCRIIFGSSLDVLKPIKIAGKIGYKEYITTSLELEGRNPNT